MTGACLLSKKKKLTPLHKRYLQVFTTGLPSVLLSEWLSTRLCFPGWKKEKKRKRSKRYIKMDHQIFIKWKYIRYIWILHQQQFIGKNGTAALQLKKKGQKIYIWANAFTSTTIMEQTLDEGKLFFLNCSNLLGLRQAKSQIHERRQTKNKKWV